MTRRIQPIGDLALDCGRTLHGVDIAYEALGTLSPDRDNVILVAHGFTSGPDTIVAKGDPLLAMEGSFQDLVGPGKPLDTDRYYVLCPNALGSTYGSTGSASIDPPTGKPYGSRFPPITIRDIVASQRALLDRLGIDQMFAVVGPSFGGFQALQWGVSYPQAMKGIVALLTSLGPPPSNPEAIRQGLSKNPNWNDGDYYEQGNLIDTLVPMRIGMLTGYGVDTALTATYPDPDERRAVMRQRALAWAEDFDANALLVIMKAMGTHDVRAELGKMKARVLYILSRTDTIFPPTLAPEAFDRFYAAGVAASYFEIDSDNGHSAASVDADKWGDELRRFLRGLESA
ncbi:MAG: putative acyltransferase [Bradyrhizobium sp.]|nr:putative acyltransferase [Bradyrhizobium sp.]